MADSADEIYVDVVPRLNSAAADEVERSLKDKLKGATEGISDGFKDAAHKIEDEFSSIGDKFKDLFSHSLPKELDTAADKIGDDVGDKIGSSIGDKISSALGKVSIGDKLDSALQKALGDPEKFADKLSGIFDKLDKIGGAAGNVLSGKGSGNDFDNILGTAKDLGVKIPGPISALSDINNAINKANEHPGQTEDWLSSHIPGLGVADNLINKWPQQAGDWVHSQFAGPPESLRPPPDYTLQDEFAKSHPNFEGEGPIGNAGSSSSVSTQNMEVSAAEVILSGNVNLPAGLTSGGGGSSASSGYAGSIGKGGSAGGGSKGAPSGDAYSLLGSFSQGGDVTGPGPIGQDSVLALLAPGEGVLTVPENNVWKSLMGKGIPHFGTGTGGGDVSTPAAPSEAMDAVGQPGEGGSSDQGSDGGAPGTVGGTEAPGSVQAPSDQAQDAYGNPGQDVTDPAQQGIAGGTKTSKGIQDQSYGYGKGFQVTGQGLIGFAESAPGAIAQAAASGASGGPAPAGIAAGAGAAALTSLWNTIGQPELNEAITEGVKVGADLLSAPGQELAVGGENFQNWSQKLIGGEIGNVTNLINTAANTQAPLTPQQGSGQAGQVGQAAQPQGTLGGQQSPLGTPNDPLHVLPVGGQSGNTQSSNMSSIGTSQSGTA